jgi:hypothetical protein
LRQNHHAEAARDDGAKRAIYFLQNTKACATAYRLHAVYDWQSLPNDLFLPTAAKIIGKHTCEVKSKAAAVPSTGSYVLLRQQLF